METAPTEPAGTTPELPPFDYARNSQIKKIYLEIPGGYDYHHESLNRNDDGKFLGREKITKSFVNILRSSSKKGVYLVTGYRGMGKTSFVKSVIEALKRKKQTKADGIAALLRYWWQFLVRFLRKERRTESKPLKIKDFTISLAQSELKDIDILKHIVNKLLADMEDFPGQRVSRWFNMGNLMSWTWLTATLFLMTLYVYQPGASVEDTSKDVLTSMLGLLTFSALLAFFANKMLAWMYDKVTMLKPEVIVLWIVVGCAFVYAFFKETETIGYILLGGKGSPVTAALFPYFVFLVLGNLLLLGLSFMPWFHTKKDPVKEPGKVREPVKRLYDRLKHLHDRCYSQVTKEDQIQGILTTSVSTLFNRNHKVFPLANPREIENELIEIIKMLSAYFQYIFVFDELDKVDPAYESTSDAQANGRSNYLNELTERRRMVIGILASLKYFINEAEAKFIFIAGREMFDAAMADISDRQSAIGSIFHKVIYVDSFLKDQPTGGSTVLHIGGIIERYLQNALMKAEQEEAPEDDRNFLASYYTYLTKDRKDVPVPQGEEEVHTLKGKEAKMVIFTLQNFLGYLLYRSNGSPKKVMKLFEEHVEVISKEELLRVSSESILFRTGKGGESKHYLVFGYFTQYRLGFTNYLFQPFLTMNSSFVKVLSDNTLVSIAFLMDSLIKFHPFAFSNQNLELLPEIMASNRTPISRPFLNDLISFMGQNLIRKTEGGMFEFKFYDRTHNEIVYITKLFEEEAAAFNFSHDETYPIKAHLIRKIRDLRATHVTNSMVITADANPLVSVLFLNRLLGDVYFQDEEFQEAIVSYQDALQLIDLNRLNSPNHLVNFIIVKLKLGLTYEKLKSYEIALGHYANVIEEASRLLTTHPAEYNLIYRDLLVLVMQAYLASIAVHEKLFEGTTFKKLKVHVDSFENLLEGYEIKYENRDIIRMSFYKGIGNILYFKNAVLPYRYRVDELPKINSTGSNEEILKYYSRHLGEELICESFDELSIFRNPKLLNAEARISFSTYLYYKKSLQEILGSQASDLPSLLADCKPLIYNEHQGDEEGHRSLQHTRRIRNIGHLLSQIGDYLFPLVQTENVDVIEALGCFYYDPAIDCDSTKSRYYTTIERARERLFRDYLCNEEGVRDDLRSGDPDAGKIHPRLVIHLYCMASLFYLEADERSNSAFQLRKMVTVFRMVKLVSRQESVLFRLVKKMQKLDLKGRYQTGVAIVNAHIADVNAQFKSVSNTLKEQRSGECIKEKENLQYEKLLHHCNRLMAWIKDLLNQYRLDKSVPEIEKNEGLHQIENLRRIVTMLQYFSGSPPVYTAISRLETNLLKRILILYSLTSHSSDRPQIAKFKNYFNLDTIRSSHKDSNELYSNLSNNPDTKEATLAFAQLKIKYYEFPEADGSGTLEEYFRKIPESKLLSPYNSFSFQNSRLLELNLHTRVNYHILEKYIKPRMGVPPFDIMKEWHTHHVYSYNLFSIDEGGFVKPDEEGEKARTALQSFSEGMSPQLLREYGDLVINSIYNLTVMKDITNTYEINYKLSHSFLGRIHQDNAFWISQFYLCRLIEYFRISGAPDEAATGALKKDPVEKRLKSLIGAQSLITLDALTEYQIALQCYSKAFKMHKEGSGYQDRMKTFIFLEDDFNDNLYHFGAAIERLKINSGQIESGRKTIKECLEKANMYKYVTFIGYEGEEAG